MRRSHLLGAVALSAALHAGLLALSMRARPPIEPRRERVEIEIRVQHRPPAPSPTPPPALREAVPPGERAKVAQIPPRAKSGPSAAPPAAAAPSRSAGSDEAPGAAEAAQGKGSERPADRGLALDDLPRGLPAGPSAEFGERILEQGGRGSKAFGSLIRNEPGFGPGRQALLDAEGAAVKSKVDGWMADGAAEARVNGGIVDDYFGQMKRNLEAKLDKPGDVLSGSFVKDFAQAYGHAAQQYAATGNPYRQGEVVGSAPEIDGDTPLATMAQRYQGSTTEDAAKRFAQGRMLRDFADGKFGQGLIAVVELRQGADGHLLSAKLLEASGSAEFDAHVMKVAPQALSLLGPPPDHVKVAEGGLKSHWAFEGHIVYKRKLRETNLVQDGWYLALAGMSGLMTGDFDMGGDATYVDLRHPELKVKARLLRLYQ